MTLTRTNAIISTTTMVLFCAEIKVLGMERNFARIFYINNKNFWSQDPPERGPWLGTTHQGAPPLLARPGGLYPPGGPADPETDAINSYFRRKNQEERIIMIHETESSPSPVLPREGRSGVRLGLRRGGVFVLRHHQPISIANSMMLPTGSE